MRDMLVADSITCRSPRQPCMRQNRQKVFIIVLMALPQRFWLHRVFISGPFLDQTPKIRNSSSQQSAFWGLIGNPVRTAEVIASANSGIGSGPAAVSRHSVFSLRATGIFSGKAEKNAGKPEDLLCLRPEDGLAATGLCRQVFFGDKYYSPLPPD